MDIIVGKNLTKAYKRKVAVDDISFTIHENTITGVIGRNGAGKTTLLKMIAGYWRPTSGAVDVFGERSFNSLKVSANSIFVDDQMAFSNSLSLEEILESCAMYYPNWQAQIAERMLDYFDLPRHGVQSRLSKGQKSTLHMIIGLAARCALTIFDEPTTGMDSSVRKDFYRALLKDYIASPRTILLSSHQVEEIEHLLEDVFMMDKGKKLLHLPIEDVHAYALSVIGDKDKIESIAKHCDILYRESFAHNQLKVIVKNDGSLQQQLVEGVEVNHVPAHDLVVYLAKREKGGIDHVFQ